MAIIGKILLILFIIFKSPPIQTFITNIIAEKISEKLQTRVEVGGVDFSVFKTIVLHDIYVEDRQKDTLFYIRHLNVNLNSLDLSSKIINAKELTLWQPECFLKQDKKGILNLQFIIDALSGDTTDTTPAKPFKFFVDKLAIKGGKFKYDILAMPESKEKAVSFDHLGVSDINLKFKKIAVIDDSIVFNINSLSFIEKSGLILKQMNVNGYLSESGIHLQNLYLETPNSLVRASHFEMKTKSLNDFNEFEHKVKFDASFYASKIGSEDIAFFAPELHGFNQTAIISGKAKGPLASIKAKDFLIKYNKNTFIKGNYEIEGLPDIENSYILLKFDYLKTKVSDFANLELPPFDKTNKLMLPSFLNNLGEIYYKGELSGFTTDFVAYGKLNTDLGTISSDASISFDTIKNLTLIKGNVSLNNFNAGKAISAQPLVGYVTLTASLKAVIKKHGFEATAESKIQSVEFNSYNYKNILVNGTITEKMFDGSLKLDDPNIGLDFLGKIDYSGKDPVFNFMADVKNAKLNKLNLLPKDSDIVLSFLLDSKIEGDNIDNANGTLDLYQFNYKHDSLHSESNNIHIDLKQLNDNKSIQLNSDFIDLSLNGKFQFNELLYYVQTDINKYLPSLKITEIPKNFKPVNNFQLNYNFTIKQYCDIFKDFFPWLYLEKGTTSRAKFTEENEVEFGIQSDSVSLSGMGLSDLTVNSSVSENKLHTSIKATKFYLAKEIVLNAPVVDFYTQNNSNEIYCNWQRNDSLIGDGEITAIANLSDKEKMNLQIVLSPSRLNLNQLEWYVNDGTIDISDSLISINKAIINQGEQYFYIDGAVGNRITDSINVKVNQVQLTNINPFIKSTGLTFDGEMNGEITVKSALKKPILVSDFIVKQLKLNGEELGDFNLKGEWNDEKQKLFYQADAFRGNINTLNLKGSYDINGQIDANIHLDKWRLNMIEPFINSFASEVRGSASGDLHLAGTFANPDIEGKIKLTKAAFIITYLNTHYNFTGDVDVKKNIFEVSNIDIYDEEGNIAKLSGKVTHQYFSDVKLDLLLNTQRFLFLNTKYSDNNLFYGSVYSSGLVNIIGSLDNISINANVQTEKGTKFNLSLESGTELSQQNFIKFVNKNNQKEKSEIQIPTNTNSGLSLSFNIQATPEANIQLIFDSKVGDIIKSQGTGNLRLELKPNGDFLIFGNYIISQGDYLFTLQNVINKKFEVNPGSVVSFSGDPLNADLDIKAIYKLRTSLYELMVDSTYKARVPVECELSLKNKLLNPNFSFAIKVPNSDSRVDGVLSALSDEEVNKQVISLLVLNRFVTPETYVSGVKSVEYSSPNAVGVNSSELLTNQLNHWLSQISNTVNLGVNYRPGDMISNEELELALNTQILNDRVTINTNLGVSNSSQAESSMLIGDFDVEVKVNKSGKLRAKGFNRTNTNILKDTSPYTQGVGIFYREEFDSWGDLIKSYWNSSFTKKKEEEKDGNDTNKNNGQK